MAVPSGIPIALIPAIMQQQQRTMSQPHPLTHFQPKQASSIHQTQNQIKSQDGNNGKSPFIGANGNWYQFDDNTNQYIDTGISAAGSAPSKTYIVFDKGVSFAKGTPIAFYNSYSVFSPACASVGGNSFTLNKGSYTVSISATTQSGIRPKSEVEDGDNSPVNTSIALEANGTPTYYWNGEDMIGGEISFVVPADGYVFKVVNNSLTSEMFPESENNEYQLVVTKWS